jgi:hypothetical protein
MFNVPCKKKILKLLILYLSTVICQFLFKDEAKRNCGPFHAMKAWEEVEVSSTYS